MQDRTPVLADDEKAIQDTKRERWDGEEIHRRNEPSCLLLYRHCIEGVEVGPALLACHPSQEINAPRIRQPAREFVG